MQLYCLKPIARHSQRCIDTALSGCLRITQKQLVTTGGSRGLGLEMARVWLREGARVAVCAPDGADLDRATSVLRVRRDRLLTHVCDVRVQGAANQFVQVIERSWGGIDVLVNNAGIIQVGPLETMDIADFEDAMLTHFW